MTTQMQVGAIPEKKDNTIRNTLMGAGAIAGGVYGATKGAPAKYASYADLVEDATKGDEFKLATAAENASDEVKDNFKTVSDSLETTKSNLTKVEELFKAADGQQAPETKNLTEIAQTLNLKNVPTVNEGQTMEQAINGVKQNSAVAELLSGIAKDGDVKITDDLKNVFRNGETQGTENQVKAAWKAIVGSDFQDNLKMTDENLQKINSYISENKSILDLANAGTIKNGDITLTAEQAKNFVKNGSSEAQDAVGKLGKLLGTNKMSGAIKWGAIGLVVTGAAAWLYSKFFGNKEAA